MSQILTRQQIAILYGLPADTKEVYAHGARIKHTVPGAKRKRYSVAYDAFGRRVLTPIQREPAAQAAVEPDVTEQIF